LKRTKIRKSRRVVIQSFITSDVLGLQDKLTLKSLLGDKQQITVEYTLRLLNAIASEVSGIEYLLAPLYKTRSDPFVLDELARLLKKEASDTLIRQNIVGILQMLSIRKKAQT
jgi:hypothetical protein